MRRSDQPFVLGDRQWEVEWCPHTPWNTAIQNDPDGDLAQLRMEARYFPSKGLAISFAKRLASGAKPIYGWIQVREQEYALIEGTTFRDWQQVGGVRYEVGVNSAGVVEVVDYA